MVFYHNFIAVINLGSNYKLIDGYITYIKKKTMSKTLEGAHNWINLLEVVEYCLYQYQNECIV